MSIQAVEVNVLGQLADGRDVHLYRIAGDNGSYLELSDLGARMTRLVVPDKDGRVANVLQDFDTVGLWATAGKNHGATCGRFANRIAGASFILNDETYELNANEGANTLHGGIEGFNVKLWSAEIVDEKTVEFTYVSADGEEGFPGELTAKVRYHFAEDTVSINESATSTKDTVIGLCNHAYFSIGSASKDHSILEHTLQVVADQYTVVDETLIPTGELRPVAGSAFDFREPKALGLDINSDEEQVRFGGGFDHNFVLNKKERGQLELAAVLHDPASGRTMFCHTTKPGLQIYSGNSDIVDPETNELIYRKHGAVCLETQGFPNSTERTHFPSPILRAGDRYDETTIYSFTIE